MHTGHCFRCRSVHLLADRVIKRYDGWKRGWEGTKRSRRTTFWWWWRWVKLTICAGPTHSLNHRYSQCPDMRIVAIKWKRIITPFKNHDGRLTQILLEKSTLLSVKIPNAIYGLRNMVAGACPTKAMLPYTLMSCFVQCLDWENTVYYV